MIEKTLIFRLTLPIGYITIGILYSPSNGSLNCPQNALGRSRHRAAIGLSGAKAPNFL